MKVSDYIVRLLEDNHVTDIFGIPGVGCVHFINSLIDSKIKSHLSYNEQGAAFAACGYAQSSRQIGIAFTTAGPGATNLITGIANAYADSIPTLFIVGEKDLSELKGSLNLRQKTSQEVDIVDVCKPITKWAYQITSSDEIRSTFEKALYIAQSDRPGPVLIDFPSDIARSNIDPLKLSSFLCPEQKNIYNIVHEVVDELNQSSRPLILAGNGVKVSGLENEIINISRKYSIPIVSTLISFDIFTKFENYFGFIGMDGDAAANKVIAGCDLLITLGARLNFKQTGKARENFAKNAKIYRVDADENELKYLVRDEVGIFTDVRNFIENFNKFTVCKKADRWLEECRLIRNNSYRKGSVNSDGDRFMSEFLRRIPEDALITVDTGSHRRWLMSQIVFKRGQRVYQSSGLASMGYSLPASIGVYYATKRPVVCINGDGGLMMNVQELQQVHRDNLPITVVVFNNHVLGDIMEFQKKIFEHYYITTESSGYQAADYRKIADAFNLIYTRIEDCSDMDKIQFNNYKPQLIEIVISSNE